MGCFLLCFPIPTKNSAKRVLPGDSKIVSHESLDSSVSQESTIPSNSQLSKKLEERSSIKTREKVRFNMNVQMYDPILDEETSVRRLLHNVESEIKYRYMIPSESYDDYLL
ncbi:hypothetical protein HRI_003869300 [Hibiscus trionum]|uniref:Uncharacterized protein n=1 Tax=Hibiscus trionum TaxID=183268 RepID=A0A9W7ITC9_HIBTR|nr:hypothetical protein HRI_003869300 [Hibiscus trionum]